MLRHLLIWIILGVFSLVHTGCGSSEAQDDLRKYNSFNPSSDFVLKDQDGRDFHLKDHRGKTVILFFGYLSCPDICPTTLSKLARVYKLLGTDQEKVLTVFVTVDPERDSPSKLKEYLEYFSIKAVGLTGTKAEVDEVVEAYGASYEKVYGEGKNYLMNHSDYLYLINGEGKVCHLFRPEDRVQKITDAVKMYLKS